MLCLFSLETVIASTSTFKYGVFFLSKEALQNNVIFPNRPSEALFPKNLTGIFHRGGIDQSLINQFPPS